MEPGPTLEGGRLVGWLDLFGFGWELLCLGWFGCLFMGDQERVLSLLKFGDQFSGSESLDECLAEFLNSLCECGNKLPCRGCSSNVYSSVIRSSS